jgi:hypothetical protein
MGRKPTSMDEGDDIDQKIDRVNEIRDMLQQAETMNPADAKRLHDEAMELLDEIEGALDIGDGSVNRVSE